MKNFIRKCAKGEQKLWVVFWPITILGNLILSITFMVYVYLIIPFTVNTFNDPSFTAFLKYLPLLFLGLVCLIFGIWFEMFTLISVWKCSWNSNKRIWGYLARGFLIIAIVIGIIEEVIN